MNIHVSDLLVFARRHLAITIRKCWLPATVIGLALLPLAARSELSVPAFTAYLDPINGHARISSRGGISGWNSSVQKILWFGEIKNAGALDCSLAISLPEGATSHLKLSVAGHDFVAAATGSSSNLTMVHFGSVEITAPGYQKFSLENLNPDGQTAGSPESLVLNGPASADAQFNLKPRRNAASVHLNYITPQDSQISAFYCELTAVEDPLWTYYMACGWHRGYFGMQVNSATERRIIFSVWDSGNEKADPSKVAAENRVTLVAKGPGVDSGDFGNEGTGGHSHLVFPWKTGEKQRFLVTARPSDATHTIFSGYYFRPDTKAWMLISSWKAPKDGGYLRHLYSFSENFGGDNGHLHRKALYGNQWIRASDGKWSEITSASFSHDPTGRADRFDRFMGVENGQFFLSNGGFVEGFTKFGERFTRPSSGEEPADFAPSDAIMDKLSLIRADLENIK